MTDPIARKYGDYEPDLGDSPQVQLSVTPGGAAEVLINRPDRKNAFNAEVVAGLHRAFETLHGAEGVRVVFLRGAGGTFSAGADLDWMREQADAPEADNRADALKLAHMLKALHDVPALTVALVEGVAMGGGAGLVAACDIPVAALGTQFGFTEARLGILPAVISPYVVAKIGESAARELFLTGERFEAVRACEIGLIRAAVPEEDLDATVSRRVNELLQSGPRAIAEAKALIREVAWRRVEDVQRYTVERIADIRVTEEAQEGMRAFLEKRKPSWVP